jgi:ribosomal-protein-alanine N-acetyltransferase
MMVPLTPAHAVLLAAIHADCFTGTDAWPQSAFAALLTTPAMAGLLDPRGGFVVFRHAADTADVVTLAVTPAARRQGIAAALLTQAMAQLHSAGVRELLLEVAATNAPATALYATLGFQTVGHRPAYYTNGADALVLRRAL